MGAGEVGFDIPAGSIQEPEWDTDELQRDFTVIGFMAPFVEVVRKADGQHGTLTWGWVNGQRVYFDFVAFVGDK